MWLFTRKQRKREDEISALTIAADASKRQRERKANTLLKVLDCAAEATDDALTSLTETPRGRADR